MGPDICRLLQWDSEFWGFGCAEVLGGWLQSEQLSAIEAWCDRNGVTFLQCLVPADDIPAARAAEGVGFHLVDERLTLARDIAADHPPAVLSGLELRPARDEDLHELEAIARVSHTDSRYYHDPGFPRSECDSLYATWIRRSLERVLADVVFVPVVDGKAAGYVTCRRDAHFAKKGWIGLLGVAPEAQGRGLGGALVRRAIEWFEQQEVEEALVVTQGRNQAAQRVYRSGGFLNHDIGLWYHKWYRGSESGDRDQRGAQRELPPPPQPT